MLLDHCNGAELPAALFHGGSNKGSAITLKGTEGGKLTLDADYFIQVLIVTIKRKCGTSLLLGLKYSIRP